MAAHDPLAGGMDGTACLSGLAEAGATWAEIAGETGHDWRTVKRYLSAEASSSPPAPARRGRDARKIDPYAHLVEGWLAKQPKLKAVTI
jgi:predicted transcriptional regulator